MAMTGKEFLEAARTAREERLKSGLRNGPTYNGDNGRPLIWFDQAFAREAAPAGEIECPEALRVGATQNGLDVALVASHANAGALTVAAGTTLTLVLLEGDGPDADFEEVGPSVCVTAPAEGISVEPDMLVARFAIGNMRKPWCRVRLKIEGDVSGGTLDVTLAYAAR